MIDMLHSVFRRYLPRNWERFELSTKSNDLLDLSISSVVLPIR